MTESEKPNKPDEVMAEIREFDKLAERYGWSWNTYRETPVWVIRQCLMIITEERSSLEEFIGSTERSVWKCVLRLFGKKADETSEEPQDTPAN